MAEDYIEEFFGAGGILSRTHPRYTPRPGQVAMARWADAAIARGEGAILEAMTGTGKSLAYLVPAIRLALVNGETPVIVATANIALQEQLVQKDLPFLQSVIPWKRKTKARDASGEVEVETPFTFALLKGKGNYLCESRMDKALARGVNPPLIAELHEHIRSTDEFGDIAKLPMAVDPIVLSQLCGHAEDCANRCKRTRCCNYQARARAKTADVIVVNYHLLFSHFSMMMPGVGGAMTGILPAFRTLICDEAHEVAEIARDFLGWKISDGSLIHVFRLLGDGSRDLRRLNDAYWGALAAFSKSSLYKARLRAYLKFEWGGEGKAEGYAPPELVSWPGARETAYLVDALGEAELQLLGRVTDGMPTEEREELANAAATCVNVAERIRSALECAGDPNRVYFIETNERDRVYLQSKEVHVAQWLRSMMFETPQRTTSKYVGGATVIEKCPQTVIFSSATLSTGGDFNFISRETGFVGNLGLSIPSPFDFLRRCLVVVPEMKCDPTEAGFTAEVSARLVDVIKAVRGRTLGLFTSYKALNDAHAYVSPRVPYPVLKQGTGDRSRMIRKFRDEIETCLFGTSSLWVGVDVPGESLTCLAIDKLPFPSPGDPIMSAIQAADSDWFSNYSLPLATTTFKQGVGRLIRSETDYGVVVLFDKRLVAKSYGSTFFKSLPPCQFSRSIEDIPRFLAQFEGASCQR